MNARLQPIGRYAEAPADEPDEGALHLAWLDSLSDTEWCELVRSCVGLRAYRDLTDAVMRATADDFAAVRGRR